MRDDRLGAGVRRPAPAGASCVAMARRARTHAARGRRQGNTRRTVRLLAPLRSDLVAHRLAQGRPRDTAWIFPGENGERWTNGGFDKRRGRVFVPARARADIDAEATPYTLRHSFASPWPTRDAPSTDIARQLGHGADVSLEHYQHVIDELEGSPRLSAEDAIRQARAVPLVLPQSSSRPSRRAEGKPGGAQSDSLSSAFASAPSWIRTSGLLLRKPGKRRERRGTYEPCGARTSCTGGG